MNMESRIGFTHCKGMILQLLRERFDPGKKVKIEEVLQIIEEEIG